MPGFLAEDSVSIRINTFTSGATLRKAQTWPQQIAALSGVTHHFRSNSGETLVSTDNVSAWVDIISAGSAVSGSDGLRPRLLSGQVAGYHAHVYDGTNDRMTLPAGVTTALAGDFSLAFFLKINAIGGNSTYIASSYENINIGALVSITSAGKIKFTHGNTYVESPNVYVAGDVAVVIVSLSGAFIRGRANGYDMLSAASVRTAKSNLARGAQNMQLGALNSIGTSAASIAITDFIVFNRGIGTDGPTVATLEEYASAVYGVALPY
jgi:hypothetical protein